MTSNISKRITRGCNLIMRRLLCTPRAAAKDTRAHLRNAYGVSSFSVTLVLGPESRVCRRRLDEGPESRAVVKCRRRRRDASLCNFIPGEEFGKSAERLWDCTTEYPLPAFLLYPKLKISLKSAEPNMPLLLGTSKTWSLPL